MSVEGGYANVEIIRSDMCSKCGACQRFVPGSKELIVKARNRAGATAGDTVELEMDPSRVLVAAFYVYGLPLIALAVGFVLGSALLGRGYAVPSALGMFALSFVAVYHLDKRAGRGGKFLPEVIKVV